MVKFFFGQHFWIFIVFFLTSASYLSALSVNHLLRLSIKPAASAPLIASEDGDLQLAKTRKDARVILQSNNIFDPNAKPITPQEAAAIDKSKEKKPTPKKIDEFGCPPVDEQREYPESQIRNLWIKGTSVASDPRYNLAAFYLDVENAKPVYDQKAPWQKTTRTVEIFRVGDTLATTPAKLCFIGARRVVLIHRNTLEQISLDPKSKKGAKPKLFGAFGVGQTEEEFKADRVDDRTIQRSLVQDWLANPMQHAMSARVMPHYEGGQSAGFRLVWIKEGSIYSKLGLQSGDVLQQINGKTLSVGSALGLMSQLPFAKNLSVNLIRQGVRQSINFNIK
ncbi:hypothetical protein L6R29_22080 [Myxococcota bacterium]|nr:hypothetical protein [Myxococcota bacterium]